jgi:hypothetical protein
MSAVMQIKATLYETQNKYPSTDPDTHGALRNAEERLLLDTIEGESGAFELMDRIIELVVADEALVESGKARLKRIEARADRHREILKAMMAEIAEKVERPLATLSLGTGPRTAVVTDAKLIPEVYWRRAIDKQELLRGLKAGAVEGAELSNGAPVLTLRKV